MTNKIGWQALLASLQDDLRMVRTKGLDLLVESENCFQLSIGYWAELKRRVESNRFVSVNEEIYFFKNIKPHFTSEIEYYKFLYCAHVFEPVDDRKSLRIFWLREVDKLNKFLHENKGFYDYFKSGGNSNDIEYFTQAGLLSGDFPNSSIYAQDESISTVGDHLVAQIMALERYKIYVAKRLSFL